MRTLKSQRGVSFLGWMAIASMAGILSVAGIKLFPVYVEYYSIVSILEKMQSDPALKGKGKPKILESFRKRLKIDNISRLVKGTYKINKVKGKKSFAIQVDYEAREPLFGNLSIVASFKKSAEVGGAPDS